MEIHTSIYKNIKLFIAKTSLINEQSLTLERKNNKQIYVLSVF